MPRVTMPGVIGLPEGTKETGKRVDFKPDDYALAVETKGYRLAWSRSMLCPGKGVNNQTQQADPNCELCDGIGWLEFEPRGAVSDPKVRGKLGALQTQIVADTNAAVIMGIMHSFSAETKPHENATRRIEGMVNITTRAENKLGYNDRLVNLDATIVYAQLLIDEGSGFKTRYPIVEVNHLRSATVVYWEYSDFEIVSGELSWIGAPPASTEQLAIHYLTHPYWRVVEHPHMTRQTLIKHKNPNPQLPSGDPVDLPVAALARLEFLT